VLTLDSHGKMRQVFILNLKSVVLILDHLYLPLNLCKYFFQKLSLLLLFIELPLSNLIFALELLSTVASFIQLILNFIKTPTALIELVQKLISNFKVIHNTTFKMWM
jgi:hypothetical protein